jgi:hypothetical protein
MMMVAKLSAPCPIEDRGRVKAATPAAIDENCSTAYEYCHIDRDAGFCPMAVEHVLQKDGCHE